MQLSTSPKHVFDLLSLTYVCTLHSGCMLHNRNRARSSLAAWFAHRMVSFRMGNSVLGQEHLRFNELQAPATEIQQLPLRFRRGYACMMEVYAVFNCFDAPTAALRNFSAKIAHLGGPGQKLVEHWSSTGRAWSSTGQKLVEHWSSMVEHGRAQVKIGRCTINVPKNHIYRKSPLKEQHVGPFWPLLANFAREDVIAMLCSI